VDLVDEQDAAVRADAKLVLGVHQQQAALRSRALAVLEQRQRRRARLLARTPCKRWRRGRPRASGRKHGAVPRGKRATQCSAPQEDFSTSSDCE